MKKLKMGIIGAGGIARDRHIPAYLNIPHSVSVEAICDRWIESSLFSSVNGRIVPLFRDIAVLPLVGETNQERFNKLMAMVHGHSSLAVFTVYIVNQLQA